MKTKCCAVCGKVLCGSWYVRRIHNPHWLNSKERTMKSSSGFSLCDEHNLLETSELCVLLNIPVTNISSKLIQGPEFKVKQKPFSNRKKLNNNKPRPHLSLLDMEYRVLSNCYGRISKRHLSKKMLGDFLTWEEFVSVYISQEGKCHYTSLTYVVGNRETIPLSMSIDRIDSSVGYTKENVVLCCWFVNCAKNKWSLEEIKPLWSFLPK